jgi:hypothetical protein
MPHMKVNNNCTLGGEKDACLGKCKTFPTPKSPVIGSVGHVPRARPARRRLRSAHFPDRGSSGWASPSCHSARPMRYFREVTPYGAPHAAMRPGYRRILAYQRRVGADRRRSATSASARPSSRPSGSTFGATARDSRLARVVRSAADGPVQATRLYALGDVVVEIRPMEMRHGGLSLELDRVSASPTGAAGRRASGQDRNHGHHDHPDPEVFAQEHEEPMGE